MIPFGGRELRDRDRYVLIKALPDGTPVAVRPMPSLETAQTELGVVNGNDGGGWHILDLQENKRVLGMSCDTENENARSEGG